MPGKLFIPLGIPGCGKSSWGETTGYEIVSSDAIRAELGDVNDQSKNDEVFDTFHHRIKNAIYYERFVIADATNLRDFARERLRKIAEAAGAETHLVIFANVSEAVLRNRVRDRKVPNDVMLRMLDQYERAMLDIHKERYTSVTEIRSYR
jgi:predicted kinase